MGKFGLDGAMIPRTVRRMFDERSELREPVQSQTATLFIRGRRHVVRLVNVSPSGAMLSCPFVPHIGERASVELVGHAPAAAHVCWVRDGKIGVNFVSPLE